MKSTVAAVSLANLAITEVGSRLMIIDRLPRMSTDVPALAPASPSSTASKAASAPDGAGRSLVVIEKWLPPAVPFVRVDTGMATRSLLGAASRSSW